MAILKGEAARQWLAANPNRAYTNLTTNQQVVREPGFLERLGLGITKPFRTALGVGQEFGNTIRDLSNVSRGDWSTFMDRPDRYALMSEEETEALQRDPVRAGLKSAAGTLAYAVPGGAVRGTVGTGARIGQAAARGLGAGALSGFGLSEEGEELGSTLTGGALGGILGGGLQGVSEISRVVKTRKLADNLAKTADDFEVNAYTKRIGSKPTMGQGKYDLARDSLGMAKAKGVNIKNADDLYAFSDDLFREYGPVASQYAQQFDNMGGAIPLDKVKEPLLKKLAETKTKELRAPIERVLKSIDEATGGAPSISASDLLQLRREWGNLGNWSKLTPAKEQAIAKAWETAYSQTNNVLDDAFKSVGLDDFKEVNKALKTAIEQQNWARRTAATRSGQQVWTDMAQDATMFGTALGSGPGGLAGFAASKGLQRYGEDIASKGLRTASKVAGGTSALGEILPLAVQVGQRAIPVLPALLGQGEQAPQVETPEVTGYALPQGPQIDQMALIDAVLSGAISTSEADWLMKTLGGGQESTLETAINELERLYGAGTPQSLSLGKRSTGISGLVSKGVAKGRTAFDQEFADRKAAYDQARALAVGIINQAREAGVLNEGEYQVMIANMPNEYTTEKVAQDWFTNVRRMLANKGKTQPNQQDSALYEMLGLQ